MGAIVSISLEGFSLSWRLLKAAFFLWFLCGCSPRFGQPGLLDMQDLPNPVHLYGEILSKHESIHRLQGTAQVTIKTDERRARLDAVIACDRSGHLRFEVLGFMDHVVFLALFQRENLLTYSVSDNTVREGPHDPEQIRDLLGIALDPDQLIALTLGSPFFVPLDAPEVSLSQDRNAILLDVEQVSKGLRYLVWVDAQRRPRRCMLLRQNKSGRTACDVQVDFDRYRSVDSFVFPLRVRVTGVGTGRFFELDYQSILLNRTLPEDLFRFQAPVDAERMTW
jgi:hypothetical protein